MRHSEASSVFKCAIEKVNKNQTDMVYLGFQKSFRFSQEVI